MSECVEAALAAAVSKLDTSKLKKVEVSAPLGPPPPKAMSSGDGGIGGLAEAIAASQKRRAKALANLP